VIQLPSNATSAALALALGVLLGAGAYHVLSPSSSTEPLSGRTEIAQLGRYLQPRDTAGQDEADVEVRYKTRTETDTIREVDSVYVPIPSEMDVEGALVSTENPLDVGTDRVEFTAWDPQARRYEKRLYEVPSQVFEARLYALARLRNPPRLGLGTPRLGLGLGASLRYRSVELHAQGTLSPTLEPLVAASLRIRL